MAMFVKDANENTWVNLERAAAICAIQPEALPGKWVVVARFTGRQVNIGPKFETEAEAVELAEKLAARANNGPYLTVEA